MKEIIVFTALVILALTSLMFQSDINKMQLADLASDNLSQEIAFGAGMIETHLSNANSLIAEKIEEDRIEEERLEKERNNILQGIEVNNNNDKALEDMVKDFANDSVSIGVSSDYLSKVGGTVQSFDISNSDDDIIVRLSIRTNDFLRIPFSGPVVFSSKGHYKK